MQVVEYYLYMPAGTSLWGQGYTLLPWSGAEGRARNHVLCLGLVQERGPGLRSWLSLIQQARVQVHGPCYSVLALLLGDYSVQFSLYTKPYKKLILLLDKMASSL